MELSWWGTPTGRGQVPRTLAEAAAARPQGGSPPESPLVGSEGRPEAPLLPAMRLEEPTGASAWHLPVPDGTAHQDGVD